MIDQAASVQLRIERSHSLCSCPLIIAATANAKGSAKLTYPISNSGGCTSIPGSINSGLRPLPSNGAFGRRTNGLEAFVRTTKKNVSIPIKVAKIYGTSAREVRLAVNTKSAENRESTNAQ